MCPVKEKYDIREIINTMKLKESLSFIENLNEEAHPKKVKLAKVGPDGRIIEEEYDVDDITEKWNQFNLAGRQCYKCGISGGGKFRCYGKIDYPITYRFELWLKRIFEREFRRKDTPLKIINNLVDKGYITGKQFIELKRDPSYFENNKTVRILTGRELLFNSYITTEHILEFYFCSHNWEMTYKDRIALYAILIYPFIMRGSDGKLTNILAFETKDEEGRDYSIEQFRYFIQAIANAKFYECDITVEL